MVSMICELYVSDVLNECCVCVHLGEEWATDDVLFYATLEALRCSRVFRLSLSTTETEINSVHEETRPE